MPGPELLLPEGRVLLHIGPPKTATTAVQSGFHHNRDAIEAQGVHYAGPGRQPMAAALAVARNHVVPGWSRRSLERWPELVEEVRTSAAARVVVSSEFFADGDDAAIERVVDGFGRERLHVVLTLRSVARVLPSQWQQFTQVYLRWGFEQWLRHVFDSRLGDDPELGFWRRHQHDVLVRRWAAAVGTENVTVVVPDESDRAHVLHVFEDMTGLRRGTLVPDPQDVNRSLTLVETALMREVNRQFAGTDELDEALYNRLFRYGLATHLKHRRPAPDEARVTTPAWAVERAQQMGRDAADAIAASGVRVVGDLGALTLPPREVADEVQPDAVPVEIAARAVIGTALGAVEVQRKTRRAGEKVARREVRRERNRAGVPLREAGLREIAREVVSRVVRRVRRRRPAP